jgi:HEPN domain-containing protein
MHREGSIVRKVKGRLRAGEKPPTPKSSPRRYVPNQKDTGAVFEGAVQYHNAADQLYQTLPMLYPMYFLYHHAIELALKACLLAGGLEYPTTGPDGHNITSLYERCRGNGVLVDDEQREMQFLVTMLESGNFGHRYRYAEHPHRHAMPDYRWVNDAVDRLFAQVEIRVRAWEKTFSDKRTLPKRLIMLGKPSFTEQPVPLKPGP